MRRIWAVGALLFWVGLWARPLRVVTTIPDMADFVEQIGKKEVRVRSLSAGKVDLHFFVPRPRHVLLLRRADLLVVGGLAIDVWVNSLIDSARNPRIRYGQDGYLDPAVGVTALEVPQGKIDGASGDVHPYGNPHYWYTEKNVMRVIDNITSRLCKLRPGKAGYFRENARKYKEKIRQAFRRLRAKLRPFRGTKIVQYHRSWTYFAREFGLVILGDLEPKPGIPPSARHLHELIAKIKAEKAKLLIAEPYYPQGPIQTVVRATGIKVLRLPLYVGWRRKGGYLENLEKNVDEIVKVLRQP